LSFDPDFSAVPFDYLLADRSTDPISRILIAGAQTPEDDKDGLPVLRRDTDAVVGEREHPLVVFLFCVDLDYGRFRSVKFDGVRDQVLKDERELGRSAITTGKLSRRVALEDRGLQIREGMFHNRAAVGGPGFNLRSADAGKFQQVLNQSLHAQRAIDRVSDVFVGLFVELGAVWFGQQLGVIGDHAQRFLQIMRSHVVKTARAPRWSVPVQQASGPALLPPDGVDREAAFPVAHCALRLEAGPDGLSTHNQ
jgi:hypothetical protein